jgi:AMP nucleosidase
MTDLFKKFLPRQYSDPEKAFKSLRILYEQNVEYLMDKFRDYARGELREDRVKAFYPYIKLKTKNAHREDLRYSYGFVPKPGTYMSTFTCPHIFENYLMEQMQQVILNHKTPLEVGVSDKPMPIHFALGEDHYLEKELDGELISRLPEHFDVPVLDVMDDRIANATYVEEDGSPAPLSLFPAPRVDLSVMRLRHYTGTSAFHFQNYVIFTNYQFYIDEFVKICRDIMSPTDNPDLKDERSRYTAFVEPGNRITANRNIYTEEMDDEGSIVNRMPQMPAYHLKRADGSGITMINIGIGPSNAKTITDHVAVLRPHAWLMLGHCAGLRNSQELGDYVLAHGYLRQDNVMYHDLNPSIPVPPLAEIQLALEKAVSMVTGYQGYDLKKIMRTGTVATIDDRNWELRPSTHQIQRFSQSRAIALDMESGTVAANGFRFRVPYGTLLCVSDKPLHGQLKLPGMADAFYRERVEQHLQIGLLTMALLRDIGPERLHSRKLRSFSEIAFR